MKRRQQPPEAVRKPRPGPKPGQPPAIDAERLIATRKERGMSQLALAIAAGLQPGQISQMERGLIDVRLAAFVRLCDALDVSADYLLRRDRR